VWNDILKNLPDFPSAVLSSVDDNGYPFSIRCQSEPDAEGQVLRVQVPDGAGIQSGPAALLYHKHDEWLWNTKSFVVRGILKRDDQGWKLHPRRFVPGIAIGGFWGYVQFVLTGRRTTKRYLQKRGLARPHIPWKKVHSLWEKDK
jgi:hypothetical protein